MAILPRDLTGTYDGRPFVLVQRGVYIEGNEYVRRVEAYLLEFENEDFKYVLDYDPLLKFDPIEMNDLLSDTMERDQSDGFAEEDIKRMGKKSRKANKNLRKILHIYGIMRSPSFTMMDKNEEAKLYEKIKKYGESITKEIEDVMELLGENDTD